MDAKAKKKYRLLQTLDVSRRKMIGLYTRQDDSEVDEWLCSEVEAMEVTLNNYYMAVMTGYDDIDGEHC